MEVGGVHASQLVFVLLLLVVVAFGALARRLQAPYPIVLLVAGVLVSFVPGIPRATLDPDVIFFVVLPPLLYASAWTTSWREFSFNFVSITSLAVGLVAFTVAGVAVAAPWILPGFDWRVGFVLGAIVSPTDAIAATSTAKEMGLPRRVADVLEGESLVNDATGLLALEFAGIRDAGLGRMIIAGGACSALVIALRLIWVFPAARLSYFIRRRILRQDVALLPRQQLFIVGWSGMRGVIALAAAMSVAHTMPGREALPYRDAIVFITFCVIVATLVVQGLTLPPLVRLLGLAREPGPDCEEQEARRIVLQSALSRLEPLRAADGADLAPLYDDVAEHYRRRLASLRLDDSDDSRAAAGNRRRLREVSLELLRAEREAAIRLREERRINDDVLRQIEHELDLREARLRGMG